jgi:hypothetical protein
VDDQERKKRELARRNVILAWFLALIAFAFIAAFYWAMAHKH